jgi:hypothetical protein
MVSHISQVEHGSPLAGAGAAPLRALIVLLAADTALAPLAFRIPVGASVVEFWCMLAGRVERDDIRLWCLDEAPAEFDCGIDIPFGRVAEVEGPAGGGPKGDPGPWLMSSVGSEMGIRMDSSVKAEAPPRWRRLEMARAYEAR